MAQTDPNRCAVLCANLGGDTDTIGAMAHGTDSIVLVPAPTTW
nr:hypothetical protein [Escherichia coli]